MLLPSSKIVMNDMLLLSIVVLIVPQIPSFVLLLYASMNMNGRMGICLPLIISVKCLLLLIICYLYYSCYRKVGKWKQVCHAHIFHACRYGGGTLSACLRHNTALFRLPLPPMVTTHSLSKNYHQPYYLVASLRWRLHQFFFRIEVVIMRLISIHPVEILHRLVGEVIAFLYFLWLPAFVFLHHITEVLV